MVRDVRDISRKGGGWIPCFNISIANREDKLILRGSNSDNYLVKLMYEMLNRPATLPLPFPDQTIWNPMVPLKVGFLLERCIGLRC